MNLVLQLYEILNGIVEIMEWNRRGERKEWRLLPYLEIVADGKGPKAKVLGGAKFTRGYHSSAQLEFRLPACHSGRLTQKINFRPLKRGRFWIQFYEPEGWQRRQDGLQLYRIIIVISSFSISLEHSLSLFLCMHNANFPTRNFYFERSKYFLFSPSFF